MPEIIDQETLPIPSDELYHIDHDRWIGEEATRLGFPIAGTVQDIYEDAVILLPPSFRFEWKPGKVSTGRVLHIGEGISDIRVFTLRHEDGTQSTRMFGRTYTCFFALPEDTEDSYR